MNRLMAKRHTRDAHCTAERTAAISQARGIPEWAVEPYLNDLYALATTTDKKRVTFTDYLSDLGKRVRPGPGPPPCPPALCSSTHQALSTHHADEPSSFRGRINSAMPLPSACSGPALRRKSTSFM